MGQPRQGEAAAEPVPAPRLAAGVVAALRRGRRAVPSTSPTARAGWSVRSRCACGRRYGLRVLSFVGGDDSSLADVLVADDERPEIASALVERGTSCRPGLRGASPGSPPSSRLVAALGPSRLSLVERSEAPVLDLTPGWEDVYTSKLSSKKRNHYRRRRRQLAEVGRLERRRCAHGRRTSSSSALEDAFTLHELRWDGPARRLRLRDAGRHGASSTRRSGRWRRSASRGSSR